MIEDCVRIEPMTHAFAVPRLGKNSAAVLLVDHSVVIDASCSGTSVPSSEGADKSPRFAPVWQSLPWSPLRRIKSVRLLSHRHFKNFEQTGMGRSMLPADDSSVAWLPSPVTVFDQDIGQYFEVLRKDGHWYQSQYALDPAGKESFRQTLKMDYVIGAGDNGLGFLVQRDHYLFEAPPHLLQQAAHLEFFARL